MSAKVKQVLGLGVLAMCIAFPLWANEGSDTEAQRNDPCREKARGIVLTAKDAVCSASRYQRSPHSAEQRVRERDALLHYRGGEGRPRMIRAAADITPAGSIA